MTMLPLEPRPRRRTARSRRPSRWLAGLALAAILFGAGVAVGEALHDNPTPGITRTFVRTLHP
jgi:hypothetical protein